MADDDLIQKIKQMSEYLDEEAIAAALRIPEGMVHDALAGRVSMSSSETEKQSVLEVQTNPVYRRGSFRCGGAGAGLAVLLSPCTWPMFLSR